MVNFCAVVGCGNKGGKNAVSFYRFPRINSRLSQKYQRLQAERRRSWIACLKRTDITEEKCNFSRICSHHFLSGKPSTLEDVEHPDWAPCINLGYKTRVNKKHLQRYLRRKERSAAVSNVVSVAAAHQEESTSTDHNYQLRNEYLEPEIEIIEVSKDPSDCTHVIVPTASSCVLDGMTQTDLTKTAIQDMEIALVNLNEKLYSLQKKVAALTLDENSLKGNNDKLRYYTGLPNYSVFSALLETISKQLTSTHTTSLTKFQQLLLTLMKMRLDMPFSDLAYRFDISTPTASRVFYKCLDILHVELAERETHSNPSVRVHVESVTGNAKQKYKILGGPTPNQIMLDKKNCAADKIAHVCCALTNMSPSGVPLD